MRARQNGREPLDASEWTAGETVLVVPTGDPTALAEAQVWRVEPKGTKGDIPLDGEPNGRCRLRKPERSVVGRQRIGRDRLHGRWISQ